MKRQPANYLLRIAAGWVAAVSIAILVTGCQSPQARELIRWRERRLARTVQLAYDSEAGRTARLARDLEGIAHRHERDVANFEALGPRIEDAIRREDRRWRRRTPLYRDRIAAELAGNPERAADTIPKVIF